MFAAKPGGIVPTASPLARPASCMFEQAFRNIDDVLRKEAGCTTELDYTEQTSWLLFLKYLDGLEQAGRWGPSWMVRNTPLSLTRPIAGKAGPLPKAGTASSIITWP